MSQVYTGAFTVVLPAIEGTITDAKGHYRVGFIPGSSLTLTPSKHGLMFVPGSRSYANVTTTLTNQDFLAVDTITPLVTATVRAAHLCFAATSLTATVAKLTAGISRRSRIRRKQATEQTVCNPTLRPTLSARARSAQISACRRHHACLL